MGGDDGAGGPPGGRVPEPDRAVASGAGQSRELSWLAAWHRADAPDGAGLSGGERQLIALIRTYLTAAPITVLDEATCFLDPATERVAEAMFVSRGGTLIVIAHRISSAIRASRVLLVDSGRLTEGTHDELVAHSPRYRELAGYWRESYAPTLG